MIARRRFTGRSRVAAALAVLWLVAPALTALHSVDGHEHRWCAEHGAIEEGGASARPTPGGATHEVRDATGDTVAAHQACAFAVLGGASLPAPRPARIAAVSAPTSFTAAPLGWFFAQIPILSLAPKASPPPLA